MANFLAKAAAILFLAMLLHAQPASSSSSSRGPDEDNDDDVGFTVRSRSRFLARAVRKGTRCSSGGGGRGGGGGFFGRQNVCNGVRANKGKSLLFCCKRYCRNVLSDRNNCGRCGRRCGFGQRCCGGRCTDVMFNRQNCGKCGRKCRSRDPCNNGVCGHYAL